MEEMPNNKKAAYRLAVIVLNWNNARDSIKCIQSIGSWESLKPDIYVVDNASTDNSLSEIRLCFPNITIIKSKKNLGFAGGNNLAISKAIENGSDTILLLNNDVNATESNISKLLGILRARPDIAVVGPRLRMGMSVYAGGRDIGRNVSTYVPWSAGMGDDMVVEVDYVPGTAFMVRSTALERAGLLDEDFFFSGEIADLCRRMRDLGMRCCVYTGAEVAHDIDPSSSQMRNTLYAYYSTRNRFLYIKKHGNGHLLRRYGWWIGYCVREIVMSFAGSNWGHARAISLALFDGMAGKFGDHNYRFISHS